MKTEFLNKILKDILFLKDTKTEKNFKIGELIEGNILKKLENFLIIHLKNKGIVKAYSKIPIESNKILLKVVNNSNPPELKIISELPDNLEFKDLKEIFINEKIPKKLIKSFKIGSKIFINKNEIENNLILGEKLKKIPEKLGLTYEKEILEKKNPPESLKKESFQHKNLEILNFIETYQKLNNENLLFFPVFFNNIKNFKKGFISIKKNPQKKNFYTILIDLDLENNIHIQTFIINEKNSLQIIFSANNLKFLDIMKNNAKSLIHDIEDTSGYKVINLSFKLEDENERFQNIINFLKINDSIIIDIKT